MADLDRTRAPLDKRRDGEWFGHAMSCADIEGWKGWLVASGERIWHFLSGIAGGAEDNANTART